MYCWVSYHLLLVQLCDVSFQTLSGNNDKKETWMFHTFSFRSYHSTTILGAVACYPFASLTSMSVLSWVTVWFHHDKAVITLRLRGLDLYLATSAPRPSRRHETPRIVEKTIPRRKVQGVRRSGRLSSRFWMAVNNPLLVPTSLPCHMRYQDVWISDLTCI